MKSNKDKTKNYRNLRLLTRLLWPLRAVFGNLGSLKAALPGMRSTLINNLPAIEEFLMDQARATKTPIDDLAVTMFMAWLRGFLESTGG